MNLAEALKLLQEAAKVDRRKPDADAVRAWHDLLGHLDFEDAKQAVREHFATSEAYLMPIHVINGVKRIRARRLERTIVPAPPLEISADARAAKRWLEQQVKAIADGRYVNHVLALPHGERRPGPPPQEYDAIRAAKYRVEERDLVVRRAALSVACPHCHARPGCPCVLSGTTTLLVAKPAHSDRIEAARRAGHEPGPDLQMPSGGG